MNNNKPAVNATTQEIEEIILSQLANGIDDFYIVADKLNPGMFTGPREKVADVIWSFQARGEFYDAAIISKEIETITGEEAALDLVLKRVSTDQLEIYVWHLIELYKNRKAYQLVSEAQDKILGGEGFEVVASSLRQDIDRLADQTTPIDDGAERWVNAIQSVGEKNSSLGLSSICEKLNKDSGGWPLAGYIIIAGRPGMGKTYFAILEAVDKIKAGKYVNFFSFEMTTEEIAKIFGCFWAGVNPERLIEAVDDPVLAKVIRGGIEAVHATGLLRVYDLSDKGMSNKVEDVLSRVRVARSKGKCDAVFIDYIGLLKTYEKTESREKELTTISRQIMVTTKKEKIPFFVLSQLNREVEKRGGAKIPSLSDLRNSGSLEQDANVVIFPYRPEYYKIYEDAEGRSLRGVTTLIIGKWRGSGQLQNEVYQMIRSSESGLMTDYDPDAYADFEELPNEPIGGRELPGPDRVAIENGAK